MLFRKEYGEMNIKSNERYIVFMVTVASLGLIAINFLLKWEPWVPIVILCEVFSIWAVHLIEDFKYEIRVAYYFFVAVLLIFYMSIHETMLFDASIAIVLVMLTFSVFEMMYMINVLLAEYFVIIIYHFMNLSGNMGIDHDRITVSRLLLHTVIIFLVYFISRRNIGDNLDKREEDRLKDERLESNDADMEDFLSNISHELRTPVNVVNGMSDLLIKREVGSEAEAIKRAGIRLAYQIEDIQDYTECKRHKVLLEEENYMSTSLINDVVNSYKLNDDHDKLELVVDLDPRVPTKMYGDIKKLHKLFRHLLENAVKFTKRGGIYVRMFAEDKDYGVNLCIEITDTGIGMDRSAIRSLAEGLYQANKKRNRSSGGIGLGMNIVHGFVHAMGGFVKIESEKGLGTTVRITIPQKVVDPTPCLSLNREFEGAVLFHVRPDKYVVPQLRDFYRGMASSLAAGIHVPLYSAETVYEVERLKEKLEVSYIFMGQEEYEENRGYFEALAKEGIIVVVSSGDGFKLNQGSEAIIMPKPLYAYPAIKILNEGRNAKDLDGVESHIKPVFRNVKALVVDDEPMNLVVATSLFNGYEMIIDTASSGKESIQKFLHNDYDVIYMDHMMPEMDGVEAMKQIRKAAEELDKEIIIIALTANAVSGAREMFIREGFDGFIAKPINTTDFERVMLRELPESKIVRGGRRA